MNGAGSNRGLRVLAVPLLVVLLLVGCGSSNSTDETNDALSDLPTLTPTDEPVTAPAVMERAKSGGITIRVLRIHRSPTLRYLGGTQSDITPNAEPKIQRAQQGGQFIYVRTQVTNDAKVGLDLTCGYPVAVTLIDSESRNFTPVDGLSQIANNPECNEMLQPGFRDRMTWVFLVPKGTVLDSFAFSDVTDLDVQEPTQQIVLDG